MLITIILLLYVVFFYYITFGDWLSYSDFINFFLLIVLFRHLSFFSKLLVLKWLLKLLFFQCCWIICKGLDEKLTVINYFLTLICDIYIETSKIQIKEKDTWQIILQLLSFLDHCSNAYCLDLFPNACNLDIKMWGAKWHEDTLVDDSNN